MSPLTKYFVIEKALYGDIDTHRTVLSQAESYVHRFGPGMIVYWFGHAPVSKLENVNGDLVIVGWKLPETILWPTGQVQHGPRRAQVKVVATADTSHRTNQRTHNTT